MDAQFLRVAQEALLLVVMVSAPAVGAALVVGLVIAVLQALTQVQEQTIQVAAKLITVFGVLYVLGYWMASSIYSFGRLVFENFGTWIG